MNRHLDDEQMIQRFVDQELTADERVAFLVRLGREADLRDRVIELERLVLDAGRLPRPDVPARFVAGVMDRLDPHPSRWRQLVESLFAPRSLQWNLASAAAAAGVLLLAGWAVVAGLAIPSGVDPRPELANVQPPQPAPVLVRLLVLDPGARSVAVAGDFNGWNPSATPLEQAPNGAWVVTLPLAPGRYEYQFVVNGDTWIADPFATELSDDGFGSRNAVLDVRPPAAEAVL